MKKYYLFVAICLFCIACDGGIQKPEKFIEEGQMEEILYDVAILYGAQSLYVNETDTIKQLSMNSIFNKYGIDSISFVENNKYYINLKDNVYYNMQSRIVKRLEAEQKVVDSLSGYEKPTLLLNKIEDIKLDTDTLSVSN